MGGIRLNWAIVNSIWSTSLGSNQIFRTRKLHCQESTCKVIWSMDQIFGPRGVNILNDWIPINYFGQLNGRNVTWLTRLREDFQLLFYTRTILSDDDKKIISYLSLVARLNPVAKLSQIFYWTGASQWTN